MTKEEETIAKLAAQMAELRPSVDLYHKLSHQHGKLVQALYKRLKQNNLSKLKLNTIYMPCEYPDMGVVGEDGSATFTDEDQAKDLIMALRDNTDYYRRYTLEWSGAGDYLVKPDYTTDHDGETIYTATFIKKND